MLARLGGSAAQNHPGPFSPPRTATSLDIHRWVVFHEVANTAVRALRASQHRYQARRAAKTRQPARNRYAVPSRLATERDLCFIAALSRYTTPLLGAELLMNSAAKARPISSCSIVPNGPGMRRPNQAA